MIEILQEVTDWGSAPVFNGIYHVDDTGRLVAYQSEHGLKTFKNPLKDSTNEDASSKRSASLMNQHHLM